MKDKIKCLESYCKALRDAGGYRTTKKINYCIGGYGPKI